MNIKFYFAETPEEWLQTDAVTEVWKRVYKNIKFTYPNYNITKKCSYLHSFENGINHDHSPGKKYGFYQCIVENQDNKKYILINYYDSVVALHPNNGWDLQNIVELITTTGTHLNSQNFKKSHIGHTPSTYIFHSVDQNNFLKEFQPRPKTKDDLFFRGKSYLFRKWLEEKDNRFEIKNTFEGENGLSMVEYMEELSSQKISLCLNGNAEITYRDIESFAVSTPVLRPILNCEFHNKLIPNYHYIGVKVDDIKFTGLDYYKEKADRIYKRYIEVKNDETFLHSIASNARKWFLQNCTIEANTDILTGLINLEKLR